MTFNCPKCGAPGQVFDGLTTYTCLCRMESTYTAPMPPQPLTEGDVRRIVLSLKGCLDPSHIACETCRPGYFSNIYGSVGKESAP